MASLRAQVDDLGLKGEPTGAHLPAQKRRQGNSRSKGPVAAGAGTWPAEAGSLGASRTAWVGGERTEASRSGLGGCH